MDELRDVILHVLRNAGPHGVNRTVLIKLVYFAELESWREYSAPLTGTPFYSYHFGAYAPEVPFVAEKAEALIKHSLFQGFDKPEHRYELVDTTALPPISPEAEEIIRSVCSKYAALSAARAGRLSKETEPMQRAQKGVRLDLSVVSPPRSRVAGKNPRLLVAKERLDFSTRGSASERAAQVRRDYEDMAPYRARVAARDRN